MSAPLSRSVGLAAQELIHEAADIGDEKVDVAMTRCAAHLEVAARTLYRWLSGESSLPPDRIRDLARWFRVEGNLAPEHLAEWLGLVVGEDWEVLPVPRFPPAPGGAAAVVAGEALLAIRECGLAVASIADALDDGRITRAEAARVLQEVKEARYALAALARTLDERIARKDPP